MNFNGSTALNINNASSINITAEAMGRHDFIIKVVISLF